MEGGNPDDSEEAGAAVERLVGGLAESIPNECASSCLKTTAPIARIVATFLARLVPYFIWAYEKLYALYSAAPKNLVKMLFGLALCFYGGIFCASVAAIEAFRQMGWRTVHAEVSILVEEIKHIWIANKEDDLVDADRDGIADVKQISGKELAQRKMLLALRTVQEPKRVQTAIASLWGAYLAVLATLRLQFAQTVAMALGIVESIEPTAFRLLMPPMTALLKPLDVEKWGETLLSTAIKLVAIVIAWWLQMVISAFYSAIRGGKLFAASLCDLIIERDWQKYVEKIPGVPAPFDPETTKVDEFVGYGIAAIGFCLQVFGGFSLGFPMNLIFLPLEIVEWFLRWQITFATPATYPAMG